MKPEPINSSGTDVNTIDLLLFSNSENVVYAHQNIKDTQPTCTPTVMKCSRQPLTSHYEMNTKCMGNKIQMN